jgi:hypothetical protein
MFLDQRPEPVNLFSRETVVALKPDGVEPEFGLSVVAFDVDVGRFASVARVEEESVWARS